MIKSILLILTIILMSFLTLLFWGHAGITYAREDDGLAVKSLLGILFLCLTILFTYFLGTQR